MLPSGSPSCPTLVSTAKILLVVPTQGINSPRKALVLRLPEFMRSEYDVPNVLVSGNQLGQLSLLK